MKTQSVSFIVRANQNGTVEQIGRSSITHPKIVFKGGSIKWFDDSNLLKNKMED